MSEPSKNHRVLRSNVSVRWAMKRQSSFLMFTLGVLTAIIVSRAWDSAERIQKPDRLLGARGQHTMPQALPDTAAFTPSKHFVAQVSPQQAHAQSPVVLSGVNAEMLPAHDLSAVNVVSTSASVESEFQTAEIRLTEKLQIGDTLKLVAKSGAVFNFKVARFSALCAADPAHQPVADVALVECAERDRAEQWRYVIEAVNEPAKTDQKQGAARSL